MYFTNKRQYIYDFELKYLGLTKFNIFFNNESSLVYMEVKNTTDLSGNSTIYIFDITHTLIYYSLPLDLM